MAKLFEGGWQNPLFVIKLGTVEIDRIELMMTGSEGLIESYEDDTSIHKRMSGRLSTKRRGFYTNFSLSYLEYSPLDNQSKIKKIANYYYDEYNDYTIYLYPRKEILQSYYEVIFAKGFEQGIMKGGAQAKGNRLTKLEFKTVERQRQFNIVDPNFVNYIAVEGFAIR
jgi:hypothetical protein